MDLFSLFRSSPDKQIERARRKVKEPHGDPATRMNAARKLFEMGSPEALLAMFDRFTIDVSPSGRDEEEKEEVLGWIVGIKGEAVEPLMRFAKRERQLFWPVQALRKIASEEEFSSHMCEVLKHHWENPPASSDPTAQLIRLLEDTRSPQLFEYVSLFLEAESDDVRLASLDYLFAYSEDESREAVINCYLDSEDRPRLRAHILECLARVNWSVKGYRPAVEEGLPDSYVLTRDGKVKAVGR